MKLPFGTMSISDKSKRLVKKILDSGKVTCGKYVMELERRFADLIGVKYAVSVASGGDADALALAVLYDFGARRGDEIIVPALSFVATGNSVLQAGFKPVFVDIERDTLNIDPARIASAVTKNTRAIMPVHLMGKPARMDEINSIAKKNGLVVIEDSAEAYGTEYKGKIAGSIGGMGCFSLYAAHVITSVEGGMIVTDNKDYADIVRSLRAHGRACKCAECILNVSSGYCRKRFKYKRDIRFVFERIGYSSKMNELEAAIGLGQLDSCDAILKKRRQNLLYLQNGFKQFFPYLTTLTEEKHERIGPHAFAVIINEACGIGRDEFVEYLGRKGVDTRSLFSSMPTQCAGFEFLGYRTGNFPNAEYIGNNGFHIGVHQGLNRRHLDYFLKVVKDFFDKKGLSGG